MTEKKLRESFKKMLSDCPAVISPSKEIKGSPIGRSKIYQALRNGEIEHFVCKRGYFFTKDAFIDDSAKHPEKYVTPYAAFSTAKEVKNKKRKRQKAGFPTSLPDDFRPWLEQEFEKSQMLLP